MENKPQTMKERINDLKTDVKTVEEAIITLNHEMGEVQGELKWIRWLLMGVLGVGIGQLALVLFGG